MTATTKRVFQIISLVLIVVIVFFLSVAYIQYRDFKRALVAKLSSEASSFIGQTVTIGDLSFSPSGEVTLHNITLSNPEGFIAGKLLTIQKLSFTIRYRELLRKHLSFHRIRVHRPELTVIRNEEGRFNIAEKLREFFRRETTLRYQIDEFIIQSGIIDFNNDRRFRNDDVNLVFQNLSSERGTRTSIRGETLYADSRIAIEGGIFLKDELKRLNLSISSQDLSVYPLKESLNRSGVDVSKTRTVFFLNAEGDTATGLKFSSEIKTKDTKFAFFKKDAKEILLKANAFLNIPDEKLIIDRISLKAGGITAMTGKGEMEKIGEDIAYSAMVKINMLDLSAITVMKDIKMNGIVNSDNLHIHGSVKKGVPDISGDIHLRDAQFQTSDVHIGQMNADMKFRSSREADLAVEVKDVKYGNYTVSWLQVKSDIVYRERVIRLKTPDIKSRDFALSSHKAAIRLPFKTTGDELRVEIDGMNASYPERQAGIKNAVLLMTVHKISSVLSGEVDLSADEIMFREIRAGFTKGRGRFDDRNFSADIAQADISGGKLKLSAAGKTSGSVFPLTIKASADNIDIGRLSRDMAKITGMSYPLSGTLRRAMCEGTIDSAESVQGTASLQAEKVIVYERNRNSPLIRDGAVKADITFRGKDLDVSAAMGIGKISANFVGTVKGFGNKNRLAELQITIPEVQAGDIRETFWDIFPDGLLYAGMDGSLSSDLIVRHDDAAIRLDGKVVLNDIVLKGENGEYTVGPVKGIVPVIYSKTYPSSSPSLGQSGKEGFYDARDTIQLPSFERNEYQGLSTYYAGKTVDESYNLISVGTVSYGFELLENVTIRIKPGVKFLHIGHFSGNIFGGKLNGSAIINLADHVQYKAGFLIEGLSLAELCDRIEPIRGYITGKVNGIATLKGEGGGLSQLIGKADFWTYGTSKEKTKISKEFLQKVGGPSLRRYLGDRNFDKGIMNLYLQNGFLIFRELEISNRNFIGMKDLDIKVAPLNNRISLDHLLWSITEAAYRAQKKD